MSQPPDDRRRMPWELEPSDAAEQPTVRSSPPPTSTEPDPDPSTGAAPQAPGAGTSADEPDPPAEPVAPPAGPLLSSTPSQPTVGWPADAQGPPPVVGWQAPSSSAAPAPVEGYVIAGPWARLVAWLIDSLLVTLIPTVLSFLLIDWQPLVDAMVEQIENPSSLVPAAAFIPMTTEAFVVSVIAVGLSFLYFVGFWTGPWMATPAMRLLGLRVGDEHQAGILSLSAATKRWLAMGPWLALLAYVGAFATIAGLGAQVLQVALFISVIVNARRQGLHDRIAGSIVMRKRAAGDSVVAGCVVLIGLTLLFAFVAGAMFLAVVWPLMEPMLDDLVVPV